MHMSRGSCSLLRAGLVKMSAFKEHLFTAVWPAHMLTASIGGQISCNHQPLVSKGPAGAERPPQGNWV